MHRDLTGVTMDSSRSFVESTIACLKARLMSVLVNFFLFEIYVKTFSLGLLRQSKLVVTNK